jgi:hypothetical protein
MSLNSINPVWLWNRAVIATFPDENTVFIIYSNYSAFPAYPVNVCEDPALTVYSLMLTLPEFNNKICLLHTQFMCLFSYNSYN